MLVGIDGIDGSGKSTFADEVATLLRARGVPVVRSTVDSFHNPRSKRWARGRSSPVGFYLDRAQPWSRADVVIDNNDIATGTPFVVEPGRSRASETTATVVSGRRRDRQQRHRQPVRGRTGPIPGVGNDRTAGSGRLRST